jgi:hypothetical protein
MMSQIQCAIKSAGGAAMRMRVAVQLALLLGASSAAMGQALPAAEASPISTGFSLPSTLGSLQFAVSASQSLIWGYYGQSGPAAATNISGDLAYLSNSKRHPFSMVLSGGRSWSESGQASYNFMNLAFSQVGNIGRWNFVISDSPSYLPGTASAGLSGIAGIGDLGVTPVQVAGDTGQGVLTNYSNRISNVAAISVTRQLTGKTSLVGSGSYMLTRFLTSSAGGLNQSSAGLDNDAWTGSAGLTHQLNARTGFGGTYSYSNFSYSGNNFGIPTPGFISQTASANVSHQVTRRLGLSVAAGPQWSSLSSSGGGTSIDLFADLSASYTGKVASSSLVFTRSTNSGFGSFGGAVSDSVLFGYSRKFAVVWNAALTSSYTHSTTLPLAGIAPFTSNTVVEGAQVSRAIVRSLSAYASYTLEQQSNTGVGAVDVFSGLSQVVGFGLTYSPAALHLGRQ